MVSVVIISFVFFFFHFIVIGLLKVTQVTFVFSMTAEMKKSRRIFYGLSLHLK